MATNIGGIQLGDLILGTSETGEGGGEGPPTQELSVTSFLNLTHTIKNTNTRVNNQYIPFQIITFTHTANKSVTHNLNLTQSITVHKVRGVEQHLNLTQSIVAHAAKSVKNTLTFTQSISFQLTSHLDVQHTLDLQQEIHATRTVSLKVAHGFGMVSTVKQHREFNLTVTDNIVWNQAIAREVFNRSVSNTLNFTQSISYTPVYLNSVASTLALSQSIGLNMTYARSVTNQLIFLPTRRIYVGMGNVEYVEVPNIQYALVPGYKQGKKNKPHCVLQTDNAAITMPSPEWGDTENYGGIFTIRRSMNNVPYTYVRHLSLRKLKLPWVVAKRKAWELREFLLQNNTKIMTLTTWKGDKWYVNLTTNPFELSSIGRYENENEKVSVELEFEGLKVM